MKKRIGAFWLACCLMTMLLTGCGNTNANTTGNTTDGMTDSGSALTDPNGDGIIGNDGTGYTDDTVTGSGVDANGNGTGAVESNAEDLDRAAENGTADMENAVTGNGDATGGMGTNAVTDNTNR